MVELLAIISMAINILVKVIVSCGSCTSLARAQLDARTKCLVGVAILTELNLQIMIFSTVAASYTCRYGS